MLLLYKNVLPILLFLLLFTGCNKVEVLDAPIAGIPPEAAKIVTSKYPDATGLIASALVPEKIWQIDFKRQNEQNLSVVNTTQELAHIRQLDQIVPDSLSALLTGVGFGSGSLANFRQDTQPTLPNSLEYEADYTWNGGEYTVHWILDLLGEREKHIVVVPRSRLRFYTDKIQELPGPVRAFMDSQYIPVGSATAVYVGTDATTTYVVGDAPSHYGLYALMIIDEKAGLRYSKMGEHDFMEDLNVLPGSIQTFLRDHIAPSITAWGGAWQAFKFEDKGAAGYQLIFRQRPNSAIADAYLYFDLEGRLLWQHYYARVP